MKERKKDLPPPYSPHPQLTILDRISQHISRLQLELNVHLAVKVLVGVCVGGVEQLACVGNVANNTLAQWNSNLLIKIWGLRPQHVVLAVHEKDGGALALEQGLNVFHQNLEQ